MITLLLKIFAIAFILNLVWELLHARWYTTCIQASGRKYVRMIIIASLKDAFWIIFFFFLSVIIFRNIYILHDLKHLAFFSLSILLFSFIDEKISLQKKRWEYSDQMPRLWDVGISPLLELAATGVLTFLLVFSL